MFARQHYQKVATLFQSIHPAKVEDVTTWHNTVQSFAMMFSEDNKEFNIVRFVRACQPGANVRAKRPQK